MQNNRYALGDCATIENYALPATAQGKLKAYSGIFDAGILIPYYHQLQTNKLFIWEKVSREPYKGIRKVLTNRFNLSSS